MAKDPAFLFYSQDFIVGVQTMTYEDRGKYITVLCQMHQQGRMSEETISFLVGSISVNLRSKFLIDENGLWYNKRLEQEAQKRAEFTESRRNNGKQGGRPKKQKPLGKPYGKASAKHMGNHMGNENEDVIELGNKESTNCIKIKGMYANDKNYLIYGEEGYIEMITKVEGLPETSIDKRFLKKFMLEKNGAIFEGTPSFVINSYKNYIKNQFK